MIVAACRKIGERHHLGALALAAALVCAAYLWEGTLNFNPADEGILWYASQRVALGELPIRDFQSYLPGRYFWAAAMMALRGDTGLVSLWMSASVCLAAGLYVALRIVDGESRKAGFLWLGTAALVLLVWAIPRHKLFDVTLSILITASLASALREPGARRFLIAGATVGLAGAFNMNHAAYGVVAHVGALCLMATRCRGGFLRASVWPWLAGFVLGASPAWVAAVVSPGFRQVLAEMIGGLIQRTAATSQTNLALPVPWPWTVPLGGGDPWSVAGRLLLGTFFVAIIVYGAGVSAASIRRRFTGRPVSPVIVASAFVTLPYIHHALSRAEILHLAQSVAPMLIGVLAWLGGRPPVLRWAATAGLLAASVLVALPAHLGWQRHVAGNWTPVRLGTDTVVVNPGIADTLRGIQSLVAEHCAEEDTFLAVPYLPGAYALTGRRAPQWEVYALFPKPEAFERREIDRIRAASPRFAIVQDIPLDGRPELMFSRTHPLQMRYLRENFREVPGPFADPSLQVLLPIGPPQR